MSRIADELVQSIAQAPRSAQEFRQITPFDDIGHTRSIPTRFDWGLGIGTSGFLVENAVTTDVRVRAN